MTRAKTTSEERLAAALRANLRKRKGQVVTDDAGEAAGADALRPEPAVDAVEHAALQPRPPE
ncbi:hypothetical protein IP88_00455 [alpha proteobacterium AAP81b]|nr:hypothetical protein IP88_00455 [alpha proteobacterium AAP81b]